MWGAAIITLGAWEAAAFVTGRVPTVTRAVHTFHARHPHATRLVIAAWTVGVTRHLLWPDAAALTPGPPSRRG